MLQLFHIYEVRISCPHPHPDGLTIPTVGLLIKKMVTVSEAPIFIAILRLNKLEKAVVDGAGATGSWNAFGVKRKNCDPVKWMRLLDYLKE